MDLKWQLALLSLKARKFYQRTGKKIIINGSDTFGYDKSKVECFNCHKMGHFSRECRGPNNQECKHRNQESSKRTVNVEDTSSKPMVAFDVAGFDWSFMADEEVPTNLSFMAFSDSEIEKLKKEKESNQFKIDNFENASKSLDKLIGSQIVDKSRKGVGFENYNAVAPPPTGLFVPPTIDLSSSGLKDFQQPEFEGYGVNVNKSVSENSSNEIKKTTGAPIIEDWVSDYDEDESEVMVFNNVQHKSELKPEQAKQPRKISENPRNNRTNWNEKKTQKLGVGFQFAKKACFVYGSFNHLIKDWDFHDKKMVQKPVMNNVQKGIGQMGVRPAVLKEMCDKKNSVLFTETECLILSPDFKLPNENQVMLKIHRKDNMYSFDLKNIVPSKGLTCLIAKATNDESNMWHRRLSHIYFKTMNKLVKGNLVRGIKREFSNAKTPQQNGVAERKNRTLIEAARPMLAYSLLPIPFWAEAVNIACYVQNRVLVTKPHNKTPYELLISRTPIISFMRPFGCPVTILNTLDHLGKFDGKADEGFLVGYSINSKAFRVFNSRTRKAEENLHVNFLENKPNVARSGPEWLFDIDTLTNSMNYQPVSAGNRTNGNAGLETNFDAGQALKENVPDQEYILLPLLHTSSNVPSNSENNESSPKDDAGKKNEVKDLAKEGGMNGPGEATNTDSTNRLNTVSSTVNTVSSSFTTVDPGREKEQRNKYKSLFDPLMPDLKDTADLQDTGIFGSAYDDEYVGAEADLSNLETNMSVSPIPTNKIRKDHPKA
ncbi:ribonuclease H-like domain-containing protein [Tanacetum coccineum]|uniref:Ribonuclease H-like domain-containing protein n=1 Tax=Tanacetum coccineum TaxID=301880 RepID=A0ABQ5DUW4_9ASTR